MLAGESIQYGKMGTFGASDSQAASRSLRHRVAGERPGADGTLMEQQMALRGGCLHCT